MESARDDAAVDERVEVFSQIEAVLFVDETTQHCLVKWKQMSYWHCGWVPLSLFSTLPPSLLDKLASPMVLKSFSQNPTQTSSTSSVSLLAFPTPQSVFSISSSSS